MTEQEERVLRLADAAKELLGNKDFMFLIMEEYISNGVSMHSLYGDPRNEGTINELSARKNLNSFIFDTISQGDILMQEKIEKE